MKPFVKWVGGKRQVINTHLKNYLPKEFNNYIEPFVGGGALFFYLHPKKAIINDINKELITTYRVVEKNKDELIKTLDNHLENHSEEYFYKIRDLEYQNNVDIAARFIYLNKTGFNGLYRVNSNNKFNVPFNKKLKENLTLYEMSNLNEISNYLNKNKVKIFNVDFEKILNKAKENDFVFCDPPYDYEDGGFDSYTKKAFGKEGQTRLANTLKKLDQKNVKWMLTNHNTKFINELYADFKIIPISTNRNINSDGSKRKKCGKEVVVVNYEW